MSDDLLFNRFARLCEISSPTGEERAMADAVAGELQGLGLEVFEDDSATAARAGAGNVIARLPGASDEWVMFCAHMDTVPEGGKIEVALEDGVFRSKGDTILGADNKAAVAVLMELAARHVAADGAPRCGIELVFTVAEEDGLRGAKELDTDALRARRGFVLDHASPIGEIITAAPTYKKLLADFEGTEAHAGIRPEDGHNAILAAAMAISGMALGRLDPETTANIGVVEGGTASNVVAGHCHVDGEARSLDDARVSEVIGSMVDSCTWAASEHGCDVDVDVVEMFRGYRLPSNSAALALGRRALARCGHEVKEVATGGGSDANALAVKGYDCALLANGTEANHTPAESVAASRLIEMLAVCDAIVEEAAAGAEAS
jgi:tripeptide aminopeptidase